MCCADGLQVAAVAQTAERDALYCLSSSADGSLLVAGGELYLMSLDLLIASTISIATYCTHKHAAFLRNAVSACSAGDAMEAAVRPAHTNGTADANTSDGSDVDTLFDADHIFSSDHNGRVVFSNGVTKQPAPQRQSILHVWDVT